MGSADELVRSSRRRGPARRRNEQAVLSARSAWAVLFISTVCRSVLCTALALMLWAILPTFVGFHTTVVMSGSMSPRLQVGDAVVVRSVTPAQLSPGQILLFDDPDHQGRLRLHRVVEVEDRDLVTKGDANADADSSPVPLDSVRGAGFLRIPFAGLPEYWIRTGQLVPLAAAAVLAVVLFAGVRLDGLLEDPEKRQRRRHRGTRLPGLHRATAAVVVVVAVAGTAVVQPSTAEATYRGSTESASSWRFCNDAPSSLSPAPRFSWGYGNGSTSIVPDSSSATYPATVGANAGQISGAASSWSRTSCVGTNSPFVTIGSGSKTVIAEQTLSAFPGSSTISTWVRTGTKAGVIADFGSSKDSTASSKVDRVLYINTSGQVVFANYYIGAGNLKLPWTCTTPAAPSTSGTTWFNVVATWSYADGCTISVNGTQVVASNPTLTLSVASTYPGVWRFGYDDISGAGLSGVASQQYFTGDLDESQVYDSVVSAKAVFDRGH